MDLALQLLSDYNYYRSFTSEMHEKRATNQFTGEVKLKTKKVDREPILNEMAAFCHEYELDPRMWLFMLFKMRNWIRPPKFNQLVPRSKKTLKKNLNLYANLSDVPLFRKRISEESHQKAVDSGEVFDKNRDISHTAEALKRRYLNEGDTERCMTEMEVHTFGFHPKSLVCARCPSAKYCEQVLQSKVPFDIVALRRGDITAKQAQQLALFHGG
jgi:hypothetical protein